MYRVFSGGFSVTKVKCYVSVQVTYLLDLLFKTINVSNGNFLSFSIKKCFSIVHLTFF